MRFFLRLFLLIQFILFLPENAYPQWIQQTVPSGIMSLETISFSGLHGAAGGSGYNTNIIYTNNGGDNWLNAAVPNDQYYINTVQLMNETTGYASVMVPGPNTEAFLWKTSDGGASWINCTSLPEWVKDIHGLYFINENTGFISTDSIGNGCLLKTTDGGLTWTKKYLNNIGDNILFGSSTTGFISQINTLLKTTDGGETWNNISLPLPTDYFVYDISCKDEQNYFLITRNSQLISSKEFRTTDGGNTWSEMQINAPIYFTFSQIKFLYGSNTGFLFGSWGEMVKTIDGGSTWSVITSPGADLLSGCIVNENKWYITHSDGNGEPSIYMTLNGGIPVELTSFTGNYFDNNIILKWSTETEINNKGFEIEKSSDAEHFSKIAFIPGNGTTAEEHQYLFTDRDIQPGKYFYRLKQVDLNGKDQYSKAIEVITLASTNFTLDQNYPNPFNSSTIIKYSVPTAGNVNIKLYNILGKEIKELVNENKAPGTYTINFDASSLPSGIYFYKMQSSSYTEVKKMTLLR